MLNLLTIGYKHEYLEPLYNSIPFNGDIKWYVHTYDKSPTPAPQCLNHPDVYWLETTIRTDIMNWKNRINMLFEYVLSQDPDGYYHPNSYQLYLKYASDRLPIIGNQLVKGDGLRLEAQPPIGCHIDTGSVICPVSALKHVRWGNMWVNCPDYEFWLKCHELYDGKLNIIKEPIGYYNYQKS